MRTDEIIVNRFKTRSSNDNFESVSNSTTTLLGSFEEFVGSWENISKWSSASVTTLGSNKTSGILYIDVRQSGSNIYNTFAYEKSDITANEINIPTTFNLYYDEIRVRYLNNSVPQLTEWNLTTKYFGDKVTVIEDSSIQEKIQQNSLNQQYNQSELLTLILEELKLQTKLLKKIYQ